MEMTGTPKTTRALTLIECIKRLHEASGDASDRSVRLDSPLDLDRSPNFKNTKSALPSQGTLTIHLVGADYREGNSAEETLEIFQQLFQYLVAHEQRYETLQLVLVGPNVAQKLHNDTHQSTHTDHSIDSDHEKLHPSSVMVQLTYYVGGFDDYYAETALYTRPDLAVCFNAGLWGYDEWIPTLKLLVHTIRSPLLVTSYNATEGIDDEDILEDEVLVTRWYWRSEKNPSGSIQLRDTQNEDGYLLRENDYWMCARPDLIVS